MRPYVNGKLALAGFDSRVAAATWFDALYAIVVDAPGEILEKLHGDIVIQTARLRPDRETWGALPEHVALTNKMTGQDKARSAGKGAVRGPRNR
jgi:hypothetical protein